MAVPTVPGTSLHPEHVPLCLPRVEVALGARIVGCALRESARARSLGLRIAPDTGLVVTAPPGTDAQTVRAFLARHRRWILRWVERLDGRAALPRRWPYGTTLLYRGEAHTVLVRQAPATGVDRTPDRRLLICARAAGFEGARRVLRRWLASEAARVLGERVETLGAQMGLRARRVYVRNLRTRWGSCWPGGSLSFNYRLIMAPPAVLDYVVVHELAHLWERNHSQYFWTLVAAQCPAHHEAKRWLRTFGPVLGV